VFQLVKRKGYASTVDVLMKIGVLSPADYESWRFGRVDYLERVCKANLSKLSKIHSAIRSYSLKQGLKPSWADYRKWGKGRKHRLQFSKSGNENVERAYATHFVWQKEASETTS